MNKDLSNVVKVSVIIPIYNSQNYLEECLNSVIQQSLQDLEIICINDGSTDNSAKILEKFAQKDSRIKVINQTNRGVSVARNYGIQIATGEYISFVDSDDYLDLDYFEKLYCSAKEHDADLSAGSILRFKGKKKKYLVKQTKEIITSNIQRKYKLLKLPHWSFSCGKIYRAKALKESGILFKEGVFYEDIVFINMLVHKLSKLVVVPNATYYYRIHSSSITNSTTPKHLYDAKYAAIEIQNFVQVQNTLKGVGKHWYSEVLKEIKFLNLSIFKEILYGSFIQYRLFNFPIFLKEIFNKKVDLVYCWVNNNDEKWRKKKEYWARELNVQIDNCRYINSDELKYSLRSIAQNAEWINKIYIVTDRQIPEFLDINNSKIKIIDHEDIIPAKYLPTFNSDVIESYIDNIPELSEYFLYANDDTFIGRPIAKSYFFTKSGAPKVYLKPQKWKKLECDYQQNIICSSELIKQTYNKDYTKYEPHHNIDVYRKSHIKACKNEFSKQFDLLSCNKFRKGDFIQRHIFTIFMIANNFCKVQILKRKSFQKQSLLISTYYSISFMQKMLKKYKPYLFCLNDVENGNSKTRENLKKIMNDIFPQKAEWEK